MAKLYLGTTQISDDPYNYPYTTDIQSGVEQTRNLTSITDADGYFYTGNALTSIYVGSNVTSVGSYAFYYCTGVTSINIPSSVDSIGSNAFYFCSGLTSITIADSVTSIGSGAFGFCPNLTDVNIPNSVTTIESYTFNGCSSLTSINIPADVTSIGNYTFSSCTSLATINCLATTAPTLGNNAFSGVATNEIHVPVGATGYGATYGGLIVVADL
jgi:hypothetical protein